MYKIKVGDIVSFYLMQFASIGKNSKYTLDNEEVLVFAGSASDSKSSNDREKDGNKSGATFFLEAKKSGTCNLKISTIYRGDLKSELNYKINVE